MVALQSLEDIIAKQATQAQLEALISLPNETQPPFLLELIKFVGEPEKLGIIEKVCVTAREPILVKKALNEKWKIQTNKGKYFDCLQIAMYLDDVRLKAKSTFAIACTY